jgi:hypothetical protein
MTRILQMIVALARWILEPIAPALLQHSMLFMADVTDEFYASEAFIGYGSQFEVGQGNSPEDFVAVPEIEKITMGDMTTPVIKVTHLRSPNRHEEKRATIRDSGPIVISGNYLPGHGAHKESGGDGFDADHSLLSLWQDVTENNFKIVFPDAADNLELIIRGTVTKYQPGELTTDGKMPFTAEITPLKDYFTNP